MPLKITFDSREVRNPLARWMLTLLGLVLALLVFAVLFFLILPLVWFAVITVLLVLSALFLAGPKLAGRYRIIVINRKNLPSR